MGLIVVCIPALALAIRFNKKIEETLAVSFMMIMLLLYFPGLFMKLTSGFIIALIFSGFCAIYIAFKLVTGKGVLKDAFTGWGTLAVLIYIAFFGYYSFHRDFSHPDELYCWGLMAKNFFYYDEMFADASTVLGEGQPPLMPLLNFFFSKVAMSFKDSTCYFAQNMFTISLLVPVFAHVRFRNNSARFILLVLMLPSLMVLSGLEAFVYVLGDMVIAAALCFFIMQISAFVRTDDHYYYFSGILCLASMCLIKRMGPVFASILLFIAVPMMIRRNVTYIRELSGMMVIVALVTLSWLGFSQYTCMPVFMLACGLAIAFVLRRLETVSERYRDAAYLGLMGIMVCALGGYMILFLGRRGGYAYAVMARFMEDQFRFSMEDGYLCLPYGMFAILCILAALILRRRHKTTPISLASGEPTAGQKPDTEYIDHINCFVWISMAMIAYALIMLYVHIWQIGPSNDNLEGLIPRYMIPWEILAVFFLIYVFIVRQANIRAEWMLLGLIGLICVSDTGELYRQLFAKHQCIGYTALSDAGIELNSGDLVYFIDEQNYFSYTDREFYYCMWPAKTNFIDQIFMGNNGRVEFTADELKQMIVSEQYLEVPYDYLYLQTIDDDFADRYGELFEDPADIQPGSAYYVITDGRDLTLKPVRE